MVAVVAGPVVVDSQSAVTNSGRSLRNSGPEGTAGKFMRGICGRFLCGGDADDDDNAAAVDVVVECPYPLAKYE